MSVKKRSNPEANSANTFNLHTSETGSCAGDALTTSQYRVTVDYGEEFESIVVAIGGVNTAVPLVGVTTKKTLRVAICDALKANGYDPYYAMDGIIGVATFGNELVITGQAEVISILNDSVKAFVKYSTPSKIVHTQFADVDTGDPFGILKLEGQAGTDLLEYDTDHGSSVDAVVVAVKAALTTDGVKWNKVDAVVVAGLMTLNIHSSSESDQLSLNGVYGTKVEVYPGFV